jgi:predicted dehydrogenase
MGSDIEMNFQIAVLGATGFIGSPYRQEIRDCPHDANIVALCGRRMENLKAAASEDGAEFFSDDWQQVISRPGVNLVLVCTPDALHHQAVMACAKRGIHVVCEKPVGTNAIQARQMWEAYREMELGHFVPLWTRYVDLFRRARQIVEAGELGAIRAFLYRWHNPRPAAMPFTWRDDATLSSGGSVADVGSHAYDAIRWILGDEAQRVLAHAEVITPPKPNLGAVDLGEAISWGGQHTSAEAASHRQGTAYDYASIAVRMRSGTVGTIVLSHAPYLRKGMAPELELHGTNASLSIDRVGGAVRLFRPDCEAETVATLPDGGLGNRFEKYVFPALRDRIKGQSSPHPGLDDGYRVQLFTDAAMRSAERGEWVELSEIEAAV